MIKFTLLTTQANHAIIILEFAHLKFQRFLRPLPPLYFKKTSLNIIFTQFCILILHQNKIYSLNTTTNFYVASAKLRPLQCGTNIFAGVYFCEWRFFCVFCGTNFCDWGNCLSFLGINFCHFPEAAFYLEL